MQPKMNNRKLCFTRLLEPSNPSILDPLNPFFDPRISFYYCAIFRPSVNLMFLTAVHTCSVTTRCSVRCFINTAQLQAYFPELAPRALIIGGV